MADLAKLREALGLNPGSSDDEVRAAVTAQFPDTKATIVVPKSLWEDQQRTIREVSAIVDRTKRDERDRALAETLKELRDFVAAQTKRDPTDPDAEFAGLFPPRPESDSLDAEFAGLFPPSGKGR